MDDLDAGQLLDKIAEHLRLAEHEDAQIRKTNHLQQACELAERWRRRDPLAGIPEAS